MVAPLGLLRRAIGETRKVAFAYTRADGEGSQRTVWPLGLFFWGETWTLGAWCELRGEYRSFRLDRLSGLVVLDARFQSGGLLEDYIRVVSTAA
jgi:predicted DNA-binding transcriptional regulator YafY